MAANTLILRPTGDGGYTTSTGYNATTRNCEKFPAEAQSYFSLVNEEVADDDATYVSGDVHFTSGSYGSGSNKSFDLYLDIGNESEFSGSVVSGHIFVRAKKTDLTYNEIQSVTLYILNDGKVTKLTDVFTNSNPLEGYDEYTANLTEDGLSALNSYISQNGKLPKLLAYVYGKGTAASDMPKGTSSRIYVTQVYAVFEYTSGLNLYRKVNGSWLQAQAAYQKQNGVWVEIDEDTCSSLLSSNFIVNKCTPYSHRETDIPVVVPTCVTTGLANGKKCLLCNEVLIQPEVVPIDPDNHVNIVTDTAVAATCVEDGLTEGSHCSACGKVFVAQEVIPSLGGHTPGAEANCVTDQICTVCGKTLVTATGHSYNSIETAPTATANGYTTYTCSKCGHSYTEDIVPTSTAIASSNRTSIGYTETTTNLVIPGVIKSGNTWYRITSIYAAAFKDCANLRSVTIPASVTSIGINAFSGCTSLSSVTFAGGSKLTSVGNNAFYNCDSLTSIVIPDGVTTIKAEAFADCANLMSVTISASVTTIGKNVFMQSRNLNTITFRGTVAQWNAITFGDNWNRYVPATYVQCSDGSVSL